MRPVYDTDNDREDPDGRSAIEVAYDALQIAAAYVKRGKDAPGPAFAYAQISYALDCLKDELENPY